MFVIIGALGFVYVYSSTTIPTPNKDFQTQTTNVYYKDGKTGLGRFVEQNRESIPFAEMPKHVRDAVVAAEDRTFWTNRGIDPKGILRAAFSNAKGGSTQGASTITQQYVKIYYLSSERTFKRKIKEAFVSLKLQKQLTKSKILEGYLNTIYFGRGAYGIQAAAQAYFGVDAKDLTVQQGAVLASVLNSPQSFDPAEGPDARQRLLGRYRYTLSGMAKMGTLDAAKADQLSAKLPAFPTFKRAQTYSGQKGFMLEMVKNELHRLGYNDDTIDGGGLRVTTTFAKPVMRAIRNGVHSVQPKGLKQLHTGAVSLDNETGAVRGIFGGQDYLKSPFNWALKGGQPGSSFKPFALAAGIKDGFSLKDTFQGNSPYVFPDGSEVKNEGAGSGSQLRGEDQPDHGHRAVGQHRLHRPDRLDAQGSRRRSPPWPPTSASTPKKYGIKPTSGISLGSERVGMLDMANGYSTIANAGVAHPWYVVEKVTRASDGKTLYKAPHKKKKALDPDIAADTSYALQQVAINGTGRSANVIGRPTAGKTGTATNDKDQVSSSWYIGYTPQTTTAVMYVRGDGNDQLDGWLPDYNGAAGYFGANYPARTWAAIMQAEMDGLPIEKFPPPVFVDGNAPTAGHAPAPTLAPQPSNTPQPSRTPKPSPKPTPKPSPKPTPKPSPKPSRPRPRPRRRPCPRARRPTRATAEAEAAAAEAEAEAATASPAGPAARDTGARRGPEPDPDRPDRALLERTDRRSGGGARPPAPVADAGAGAARRLHGGGRAEPGAEGPVHADALDRQRRPLLQDVLLRHPLPLRAARDGGAVLAVRRHRWPLPGDGVPGRHLVLRVGDVPAHEAVRVRAVRAGPRRDTGRRPAGAAGHGHRDEHLLPGQRRAAAGVRAPGDVLHGRGTPATAVGRDRVRRLTRPAAERAGELGHAGGGLRGRCVLGLGARPAGADRDLPRCRHGDEALPAVPVRGDARRVRTPRPGAGVRQGVGGRRRGLGGAQPAGDADRLRAVEGVLVVQRRAGARPRVAVADGQQPAPHGLGRTR